MTKLIPELHERYIKGTDKGAVVQLIQALLCSLTLTVVKAIECSCRKVYINTRVIKHTYDKRISQEYDLLIENIYPIIKYPDKIYKNKDAKRGSFLFVKRIKNVECLCSVEIVEIEGNEPICEIATFFVPGEGYLDRYELLWEWKGGNPSS